jgi:outer membrane protein TolC
MAAMGRSAAALIVLLTTAAPGAAQPLSLRGAIELALVAHPDAVTAAAAEMEARERETAANGGWFPRVTLREETQRGNQPVYVFSSLLDQRRFAQANFAVDLLNRPAALTHHRTAVSVRQLLFEPAATRAAADIGRTAREIAEAQRRQIAAAIAVEVAQTYARILQADASARAASSAIATAAEGRERAAARRHAGMATDAEVLSLDVHVARMRVRAIEAASEGRIARATLNRLVGSAPDAVWQLVEPDAPGVAGQIGLATLQASALRDRADVGGASLQVALAQGAEAVARAALLPRVAVEGGYQWNGGTWARRAGSWVVGLQAEWSLSTGLAEAASVRAAARHVDRARAEHASVQSAARLDVQAAVDRLATAQERRDIGIAAVAHAREGERIVRDRYDVGLATTADLLRAAEALVEAEALATAGRMESAVATVALDAALGRVRPPAEREESP